MCGSTPSPFVAELFADAPARPRPARHPPGPRAAAPGASGASPARLPVRPAGPGPGWAGPGSPPGGPGLDGPAAEGLLRALRAWRTERARRDGMPAYIVFPDATLEQIVARLPRTMVRLAQVKGVGPTKLDRYGDEVLAVLDEVLGSSGSGSSA